MGYIPQIYKALGGTGLGKMYHGLQQELGPIIKVKGLGKSLASFQILLLLGFPSVSNVREKEGEGESER